MSIYNEGALLAFALDVLILHHSKRKESLHTLMAQLYNNAKENPEKRAITREDYQGTAEELCGGESLDWFFNDYVYGKESFERLFLEILPHIGLQLTKTKRKSVSEGSIGFKHSKANSQIIAIFPGSDADLAGLHIGDKVVAVNSVKLNGDLEQWLNYFDISNITLTIERNNEYIDLQIPVSKKTYYSDYKLSKGKLPAKESILKFKALTGGIKFNDVFED